LLRYCYSLWKGIARHEQTRRAYRPEEAAHAQLLASKSKVYKGFLAMEKATYCDGALPKKQKELIAVGISVVKNCESCMQWHIEQAAAGGATYEELLEAIEVSIEMGGGPATVSARFALGVMESLGLKPRQAIRSPR
jgi:AhpD family alkylhydroperoxidase